MIPFRQRLSISPFALSLVLASPLLAQDVTGHVNGSVKSGEGQPLAGVALRFTSPALLQPREIRSDTRGQFRAPLLPPGRYTVHVTHPGHNPSVLHFDLALGQTVRLDTSLLPLAGAVIDVTDTVVGKDKTDAKTATVYDAELLETLPVGRSMESAAVMSPGVVNSMGSYAIRGGQFTGNRFLLNGMDVGDNAQGSHAGSGSYYTADSVDQIQVIQSPVHAKYGMFTGGIVNAITKAGGNTFTGVIRTNLSRTSWSARRSSGELTNPAFKQETNAGLYNTEDNLERGYSVWMGGPIVKDRLWFSVATIKAPDVARTIFIGPSNPTGLTTGDDKRVKPWTLDPADCASPEITGSRFWEGKLTFALHTNHTVDLSVNAKNTLTTNTSLLPPVYDFDAKYDARGIYQYQSLGYRGIWGSQATVDMRLYHKVKESRGGGAPAKGDPVQARYSSGISYLFFNGAGNDTQSDRYETTGTNFNGTYYGTTHGTLQHQVDLGFEAVRQTHVAPASIAVNNRMFNTWGRNADGTFRVAGPLDTSAAKADNYLTLAFTGTGEARSDFYALYANDTVTVNDHLQFLMGLRWDGLRSRDTNDQPTFRASKASPRFQVTVDPSGTNRWTLRGSYAVYVGKLIDAFTNYFTEAGNPAKESYYWKGKRNDAAPRDVVTSMDNWDVSPTGLKTFTSFQNRKFDKNIEPPSVKEMSLGIRRNLSDGSFVSITYCQRTWQGFYNDTFALLDELQVPLRAVDKQVPVRAERWITDDRMTRAYRSLEIEYSVTLAPNTVLGGGYTRATLRGNSEGSLALGNVMPGDPMGNYEDVHAKYGRGQDVIAPYGDLKGAFDHTFTSYLSHVYRVGKGRFSASLNYFFQTGSPVGMNRRLAFEASADAKAAGSIISSQYPTTWTYIQGPRDFFRKNPIRKLNARFGAEIPLTAKVRYFAEITITNLLNRQYLSSGYEGLTNSADGASYNYGHPLAGFRAIPQDFSREGAPSGFGTYTSNSFSGNRDVEISMGVKW